MRRGLTLLLIFALGGCVPYPTFRKVRPDVALMVVDRRQSLIEGAKVTLISTTHPEGYVRSRDTLETGPDGMVRFPGKRALRIEVLFLHRGPIYFWNWCVEKEGFVTYFTNGPHTKVFADERWVVLKAGPSRACPAEFR